MDATYAFIALAVLGLVIYMTVVCVQKGKPWFAALGFLIQWFHIFGAIRLAKPDSRWARKHYGEGTNKLHRSEARFGKRTITVAVPRVTE
jgi:hypothetical protein